MQVAEINYNLIFDIEAGKRQILSTGCTCQDILLHDLDVSRRVAISLRTTYLLPFVYVFQNSEVSLKMLFISCDLETAIEFPHVFVGSSTIFSVRISACTQLMMHDVTLLRQ